MTRGTQRLVIPHLHKLVRRLILLKEKAWRRWKYQTNLQHEANVWHHARAMPSFISTLPTLKTNSCQQIIANCTNLPQIARIRRVVKSSLAKGCRLRYGDSGDVCNFYKEFTLNFILSMMYAFNSAPRQFCSNLNHK